MSWIGVSCNHGTFRTDNVRRPIPAPSHWLSFVKFNHLAVIDICTESPLSRFDVARFASRSERSVMNAVAVGRSRLQALTKVY